MAGDLETCSRLWWIMSPRAEGEVATWFDTAVNKFPSPLPPDRTTNLLYCKVLPKHVKRFFPVIIISQIDYADEIEIPFWVPQFNENWRHLKLTSLKRAVWCINVQSGDRSTPPFWILCCTCSDVYGAFKRETCFTWFLTGNIINMFPAS